MGACTGGRSRISGGKNSCHGRCDERPSPGAYEPLLGYIPIEQCGAAVDMVGRRLVPVKHMDLKALLCG
jgi:hypothetical protein